MNTGINSGTRAAPAAPVAPAAPAYSYPGIKYRHQWRKRQAAKLRQWHKKKLLDGYFRMAQENTPKHVKTAFKRVYDFYILVCAKCHATRIRTIRNSCGIPSDFHQISLFPTRV